MDPRRFDDLVRALPSISRRGVLTGLAGGLLAALPFAPGRDAEAKNKKKLQRNEFGCVDVGKACRGNNGNCCSGICDGNKPKKGRKDKSRCVGHDESTCLTGQTAVDCGGADVACVTSEDLPGRCATTTGKAPYCASGIVCSACQRDEDCVDDCGPGAACIPCADECAVIGGTACVGTGVCVA